MTHFVVAIEEISAEGVTRLFWSNIWKLYGLPESIVLNRGPQFATVITEELNNMLGIRTKLSTSFYPQTDGQKEWMN